eukprot:SAG31_NODE_26302_length_444_cov_1.736232_1_plen_98_part_10
MLFAGPRRDGNNSVWGSTHFSAPPPITEASLLQIQRAEQEHNRRQAEEHQAEMLRQAKEADKYKQQEQEQLVCAVCKLSKPKSMDYFSKSQLSKRAAK